MSLPVLSSPTQSESTSVFGALQDSHGRVIHDLRISVTDRCNFRCSYCMPIEGLAWKPKSELLTFEEIFQLTKIFVGLGITKLRITGGEALLRRGVVNLIENLAGLPDVQDLALTTNGYYLKEHTPDLVRAGLRRVTISLDSLNPQGFHNLTKINALPRVIESIDVAQKAGLTPVKVNCVLIRGVNDHEIEDFAEFARLWGLHVRFIEYMPLDGPGAWSRDRVVPGREVYDRIQARFPLLPVAGKDLSETARRFRFSDGVSGEIGIIAPVTEPFCGACSRIRLTSDGKLRTCLFSLHEYDLREPLRAGATVDELITIIQSAVFRKEPGHRINARDFIAPERTMSCIGG
ncbi:MAG: GTP 3',8-cyclase MoaA [Blastocatellia bacterium]|nr:GTP 3',8-cyclase MoaA [Blastocatellia bacterium]